MNDTPNTTHWKKGDVVIHDADAKTDHMLMVVLGYTIEGLCQTRYLDQSQHMPKSYANPIEFLHDPHRPDIRARWHPNASPGAS